MKLFSIIKFIIIFFAFYYLLNNDALSLKQLFSKEIFKEKEILFVVMILISTTYFIGALRWWLILKSLSYKVRLKEIIQITYIGAFFNNVLFGAYGGDLVKGYYIYKFTNNSFKSTFTILLDRGIGFIGLFLVGIFSYISLFGYKLNIFLNLKLIFIFFIIFLLIVFFFYFIHKLNLKFFPKRISEFLSSLSRYLNNNKLNFLIYIFMSIILFMIVHVGVFIISDYVFFFKIGIEKIFFLNFFTTLVNSLPLTPGGIGLGEITFVKINELFFITEDYLENIASVIVLYRLINLIVCLPGAAIYIFQKKKI